MIRYEVIVTADVALAARLEAYMRTTHIPEILATGCFADVRFDRADEPDASGGTARFRTVYHAARRADLERYLAAHTAALRADFAAHFPEGVRAERAVWEERESWIRSGG